MWRYFSKKFFEVYETSETNSKKASRKLDYMYLKKFILKMADEAKNPSFTLCKCTKRIQECFW